jgi:hypothetical protein
VLATVTFLPVDTGEAQVNIEESILTDPLANVMTASKQGGSVTVGPAPEPTSTHTPGPSPTPTETRTPGPLATPTPTATFVPGTTAVVIDPASQQVLVGQQFTVDVMVQNVSNLGAYEFTLVFNPSIIKCKREQRVVPGEHRTLGVLPGPDSGWVDTALRLCDYRRRDTGGERLRPARADRLPGSCPVQYPPRPVNGSAGRPLGRNNQRRRWGWLCNRIGDRGGL